jgi:hypothetical protein
MRKSFMEKTIKFQSTRREFLSRIPAAAAVCLGCSQGWTQDTHKFQREMPPVTYLRWAQQRNMRYIGILKHLEKDIGIKLIRTKTLMQGHDCCNHRYVLE